MIKIIPNSSMCWWCGNIANSREHRHKKTDILRVLGKGFKDKGKEVVQIKGANQEYVSQGPNSDSFKFEKVLCHNCNTTRSQKFDFAYDKFIEAIEVNRDSIIKNQEIDFSQIFQQDTLEQKLNVLRYYAKHICCRLATNNISIESDLIDFLNGNDHLKFLYFKFEIRIDLIAWIERSKIKYGFDPGNLYIGSLFHRTNADNESISIVHSFYTYRWFRMIYFYSESFIEKSFPGYNKYNKSLTTIVKSLYVVHPSKFASLTDEEIFDELENTQNGCKDNEMPEYYLKSNPFELYQ